MKQLVHKIWSYFKDSWEGPDGKFSYRRASQYIFVQLMVYMIMKDRIHNQWHFYTFLTLAVLFGFIAHLISPKQVIEGIRASRKSDSNDTTTSFIPDDPGADRV